MPDVMDYNPPCVQPTNHLQPPDDQPGLPALSKVKAASKTGRGHLWGQIHEEPMRSRNISDKINDRLSSELANPIIVDDTLGIFAEMVTLSNSGFQSMDDFKQHITEGSLLGITKLASTYIGLPVGEYVVWNVGPKTAVLMPSLANNDDVFTESPKPIEIHLQNLLNVWNKVTRAITEDDSPYTGKGRKEKIQKSRSKYPRDSKVVGAIEASGESQEELANACGIEPSQVSRIKNRSGEGSRNPSLPVAVCLAKQLGKGVEEIFTGGNPPSARRKSKRTSGAGKGTGSPYQQGNS